MYLLLSINYYNAIAQKISIAKVEPPFWWNKFPLDTLQLMLYGTNLDNATISSEDAEIVGKHFKQSNYAFVDILLPKNKTIQNINFKITKNGKTHKIKFPMLENKNPWQPAGINASDLVYLIMPDRFANGNLSNDKIIDMEQVNNSKIDGRHGGDLEGINQNLDYISALGATSIWLTPVQEMNQEKGSYHHYGISDFYNIDRRFANSKKYGGNEDYKNFVSLAHQKKLKVVMDVVLNHIGKDHPWMKQFPRLKDWVHDSVQCNFMIPALTDPYATQHDKKNMEKGWFVPSMPDLNHDNERLCTYLIQNNIWWIHYAKLDAIRLDTQPFSKKEFLTKWATTLKKVYPTLSIVGETWSANNSPDYIAYWQKNKHNKDGYNSEIESVMDFPFFENTVDALKNNNATKLYYTIANDYVCDAPENNWIMLGNHDTERFFTSLEENENKYAQGLILLATMRGIPQLYYGDEIGMTGKKGINDGYMRQNMPGGWPSDGKNIFTGNGYNINDKEQSRLAFAKELFQWRKRKPALHNGKLKHFIPKNNVYSFVRYTNNEAILVMLNFNNSEVDIDLTEPNYKDIFNEWPNTQSKFGDFNKLQQSIQLPANGAQIIEFSK